ncbi:MAG: DUF1499 domain-containing protein [Pseudomonadota bacterium]
MTQNDPRPWWRRFNVTAGCLTALTVLALVAAGPGHRFGLLGFERAVLLSLVAAVLATLGFVIALVTLINGRMGSPRRFGVSSLVAAVFCGAILVQLGLWTVRATSVPAIHDISTDTMDPPAFIAIAPIRANAPNPVDYAGDEAAKAQRLAYPDIVSVNVNTTPAAVIDAAADYAQRQGWTIVAKDAIRGRLEATATTFWFGYRDDVVVRTRTTNTGTQIDVRSKSRVGQSDLGTNAERVRALVQALQTQAP